jgi:hypothetical protein
MELEGKIVCISMKYISDILHLISTFLINYSYTTLANTCIVSLINKT